MSTIEPGSQADLERIDLVRMIRMLELYEGKDAVRLIASAAIFLDLPISIAPPTVVKDG